MDNKVRPGINSGANLYHFTDEEKSIITKFSLEWYITNGGDTFQLGGSAKFYGSKSSTYKYFLMKPTENYQELFNLEREIVVIFSDYGTFEPRSLDAFEAVFDRYNDLRIDKVCGIMISRDSNIEKRVEDLLKSDAEYQIVIPFEYSELKSFDSFFLRNRFKSHFYSRDLFAFQAPLKKDLYFFGRTDLIHKIVNRHKSGENSGLFGLRKTGKTSVIFGIQRATLANNDISIFIDCQNPSFHKKKWNKALKYILDEIKDQTKVEIKLRDEVDFTEENASTYFERDIVKIHKKLQNKNILLIFDEIEQITNSISPTEHWRNGSDFIYFWQTLRSLFQKLDNVFTYLIVGTNPKCVETAIINGSDNPVFNQIPYEYIPAFDVPQTREMVRKLGRIMGLQFDETIYGRLTEDFGGHPFLIRNVCSAINKISPKERPVRIDKKLYENGKELFEREYRNYVEMILTVLKEYYNDEFEMLKFLALEDMETFDDFAKLSPEYTNHLLGYGIVDRNFDNFSFKVEIVKNYLANLSKYKKINLTNKEMLAEISERRNELEPKLRNLIRMLMQAKYEIGGAKTKILDVFGEPRKSKYYAFTLKDILNPNKSEVYFEDLRKIIAKEWEVFERIFARDKEGFNACMNTINKYRADAHSKEVTKDEMEYFRVCASKIEKFIEEYI